MRASIGIIRITFALLLVRAALAGTPCQDVVCVETEKDRDAVTFYAISRADGASIALSVVAVNMKPSSPPILVRALSRGRTKLMVLRTIRGKQPTFDHGYLWEWGVAGATHDDGAQYHLPFEPGKTFRLFQGPNGALSHRGQFAFDFPMPLGTPVCAARAGVVIDVVDRFDEGGDDPKFNAMANKILILHDDGTVGAYFHLLRGGIRVKPGDRIQGGAIIGLSGNSGRSTGPHLHFEVFRTPDATKRVTVPVKFRTAEGQSTVIEEGKTYRSP